MSGWPSNITFNNVVPERDIPWMMIGCSTSTIPVPVSSPVLTDSDGRFEIPAASAQPVRVCAWRTRARSSEDVNITVSEARLGVYRLRRNDPDASVQVARPGDDRLELQLPES